MIVGARMEASTEQALKTGWFSETFARSKRLKKLSKLLEPLSAPKKAGVAAGGKRVLAMFRRAKVQQDQGSTGR